MIFQDPWCIFTWFSFLSVCQFTNLAIENIFGTSHHLKQKFDNIFTRSFDFHLRFRALREQKLFPNFRCFDIQFDRKIMINNLWIINLTKKVDYLLTDSLLYQMARDASLFSPHACSSLTRLTKTLKSIYCTKLLCLWNCKPQVYSQVVTWFENHPKQHWKNCVNFILYTVCIIGKCIIFYLA